MNWLQIDGSQGEGGGQLVRMAMALAALTGRPTHLTHIRAGRPRPGLAAQHLAAVRAVAALCRGELTGDVLGSGELHFRPGRLTGGEYRFDVGTAGSIALVLQAVLPVALRAASPSRITVTGGSDVRRAPPMDYVRLVFLPWLEQMGAAVRIESLRRGYYPRGGGKVRLAVEPCRQIRPLTAETPGCLRSIGGVAHVAHLPAHIPARMAAAARAELTGLATVHLDCKVLGDTEAIGQGGALVLTAQTEAARLGAAVVAQRGVTSERLGSEAGRLLRQEIEAGAGLDVHAADQLLIYMALAGGASCFTVRELSSHARTLMWLIGQFLPVRFVVTERDGLKLVTVAHD